MSPPAVGGVEYQFTGATTPLNVGLNDTLTAWVLLDPCDPPREVMISWHESASWDHRAYWGEDIWQFAGRHSMGALPAPGEWVRLEVPASVVGVAGKTVSGLKFNVHSGKVWFDRVGLEPGAIAATSSAPSWSDRLRSLGTLLTYGRMSHSALRYQSLPAMSRTSVAPQSTTTPRRYSLYTPELNLLAETAMTTSASPSIAYEYIWFGGQPVAQITTSTNEVAWYFNDHLGTPVLQTNATADVVWRVEREPYGTTFTTRTGADRHQPLSFPGQEEGVESEVAYNVYRWCRGGWGRYTQSDPIGLQGGINLYGYALGNPLTYMDPGGLWAAALGKALLGGACMASDGPFPFGDIFGAAMVASAWSELTKAGCKKCGDCTPDQQAFLQSLVVEHCKGSSSKCTPNQDLQTLQTNLVRNLSCALARDEINNTCYKGGDKGHREAAANARAAAAKCGEFIWKLVAKKAS